MAKQYPKRRPAETDEQREGQLVSLAMDLAERQIVEGTASAQVITHYLKLGSSREKLEQERLRTDNVLLQHKIEYMASAQRVEELYVEAMEAMKAYRGEESAQLELEETYVER